MSRLVAGSARPRACGLGEPAPASRSRNADRAERSAWRGDRQSAAVGPLDLRGRIVAGLAFQPVREVSACRLTKSPLKRVRAWVGTLVTFRAPDRVVSQKSRTSSIGTTSDRFTNA